MLFQRRYDRSVPAFLTMHLMEHVSCLAEFFDLIVINRDCDYLEVCEQYHPDLAIFESGSNLSNCRRLRIKNIRANACVLKLGLFNADGWCETRAGTLSEMDRWGISDFVSIAVTAAEHMPAIAENLICWPNFINPEIFRDYGEEKSTPVLFTGARAAQYPWRSGVFDKLREHYPSALMQHPGYYRSTSGPTLYGAAYARKINASMFVPTCGSVAKEVVRKHFEIPGCRACLVTERSPGLEAAGFIDMVNCVFADSADVLDKVDHLVRHPDDLRRIVDAGHALVHERHTLKNRSQILEWWILRCRLKAGERIVQPNPFESPVIAFRDVPFPSHGIESGSLHLALLAQGRHMLAAGRYDDAEANFLAVLSYMQMLPEAKFCLALCHLYRGNALAANALLHATIEYTLAGYKAADPDPVEWAYLLISFLCLGRSRDALRRARQFPQLHHAELDFARRAVRAATGNEVNARLPLQAASCVRRSVHQMPVRSIKDWSSEIFCMLKASGQPDTARRIMQAAVENSEAGCGFPDTVRWKSMRIESEGSRRGFLHLFPWFNDPAPMFRLRRKFRNARERIIRAISV